MAKSLNHCTFIGNLGADPEIKYIPSGDAVANFSIACNESYKDKSGNKVEKTEWINVVAWRKLAEIIGEWVKKGDKVYVAGKYTTEKWQDKEGNTRYSTKIIASDLIMLGGNGDNAARPAQNQDVPPPPPSSDFDMDDDIPFN